MNAHGSIPRPLENVTIKNRFSCFCTLPPTRLLISHSMSPMAWVLGRRKAGQHECYARQHRACAVQALWEVEGDGSHASRLSGLRENAVLATVVAGAPC